MAETNTSGAEGLAHWVMLYEPERLISAKRFDFTRTADSCLEVALKLAGAEAGVLACYDKGRELEKYKVPYGAEIKLASGASVKKGQILVEWDPHRTPILAEKAGIVQAAVGRRSFEVSQLAENIRAFVETIVKAKPAASKGQYVKSVTLSATMGPGVKLETTQFAVR